MSDRSSACLEADTIDVSYRCVVVRRVLRELPTWKWAVFDNESELSLAESGGAAHSEDQAQQACAKSLAKIIRDKMADLEALANRLESGTELEWQTVTNAFEEKLFKMAE